MVSKFQFIDLIVTNTLSVTEQPEGETPVTVYVPEFNGVVVAPVVLLLQEKVVPVMLDVADN
jgi:hypothetical protein